MGFLKISPIQTWFFALLAMVMSPVVRAAFVANQTTSDLTPEEIVLGIICILTGLVMCFAGYRFLKVLLFLTGFYVGYWLCYSIMTNVADYENWIYFVSSLAAGIILGCIMIFILPLGIFCIGALAGFFLSIWILSFVSADAAIQEDTYRWIFIVGMALVFGVIAIFVQKILIIVSSSFVGAYLLFYGIDIYAMTGFYNAVQIIIQGESLPPLTDACIAMLACSFATAILGVIVQTVTTRDRDHTKPNGAVYVKIN